MGDNKKETIGVILLNLGGPDSIQSVRPFLYNLFSDRQIIRLGPVFFQKPLAYLISYLRSKKTKKMYSLIGNKSPLFDITMAQARALEETLNEESLVNSQQSMPPHPPLSKGGNQRGVVSFKVFVGMRYWHPLIGEVIHEIHNAGIKKLIAISLYPQYSGTTSGSSFSGLKEVTSNYPIEIFCISSWFNHPLYIEALVDVIKKGLESFLNSSFIPHPSSFDNIHVLFSAHSIPQKIIDEGDPYVNQIMGTIQEITKIIPIKWHLSYQSKSGPVKWLEPSTDEKLKKLAREGIKEILVVPISFVSDHVETLYEIDILYKNIAKKLSITLKRVDSLNVHPYLIGALKDMVIKSIKEIRW